MFKKLKKDELKEVKGGIPYEEPSVVDFTHIPAKIECIAGKTTETTLLCLPGALPEGLDVLL